MSRRSEWLRDVRGDIYEAQGGRCATCQQSILFSEGQLAHKIPEVVWAIEKYGKSVVDHPMNKAMTHGGFCNDQQNIQNHPLECDELAAEIRKEIDDGKGI